MSAQPSAQDGYEASGNNISKGPAERKAASQNASAAKEGTTISSREENDQEPQEGTSTSLGRGIRGAPAGEEAKGKTEEDVGRHNELDGAQMAAPGERDVAEAVEKKSGASGHEQGLESDLDKKKKEQAPLREAQENKRDSEVDVGGVLGQRGGPASTVN